MEQAYCRRAERMNAKGCLMAVHRTRSFQAWNDVIKALKCHFLALCLFIFLMASSAMSENPSYGDKYWIFFKDKKLESENITRARESAPVSLRALLRRKKTASENDGLWYDMPVTDEYIGSLEKMGIEVHFASRWLNAVSCTVPKHMIESLRQLSFVKGIEKVKAANAILPNPVEPQNAVPPLKMLEHVLDYGPSFTQNNQIQVPSVHDLGFSGNGVLIGMLDTGFQYRGASVFAHTDIIDEYDFHWNDSLTSNEYNDASQQHEHGTATLSVIGGFSEGELIGPAYGASYALAKTEWVPTETRIEEDHWVQGIEWLEALGADVVSSSLGYRYFDNDGWGYTYEELDGNTCVTTIAADIAAKLGVIVCNSAGNSLGDGWAYINSPADGDSVFAIGAVTSGGTRSSFSLGGPASDGRIKPDFMAMGSGVYAYYPISGGQFIYASGTSFSCPLVAGVCALLLEARPNLTPMQVRDALRNTSHLALAPDNAYGWGIVNAYDALFYHGIVFYHFARMNLPGQNLQRLEVDMAYKNSIRTDSPVLYYRVQPSDPFIPIPLIWKGGQQPYRFYADIPGNCSWDGLAFYIEAQEENGTVCKGPYGAPEYLYSFSDTTGGTLFLNETNPDHFELLQNYPNPFNNDTRIQITLDEESFLEARVLDMRGREVTLLYTGSLGPGKVELLWDGKNDRMPVPSGVYFCEVTARQSHQIVKRGVLKMLLVK